MAETIVRPINNTTKLDPVAGPSNRSNDLDLKAGPSNIKTLNKTEPGPSNIETVDQTHKNEPEDTSDNEPEPIQKIEKPTNMSPGAVKLRNWLNKMLKIEMSDGRVLTGEFLCTDRDANVILGSCSEYLSAADIDDDDPRVLGLVMIPGKHIISIHLDKLDHSFPLDYNTNDVM